MGQAPGPEEQEPEEEAVIPETRAYFEEMWSQEAPSEDLDTLEA